MAADRLEEKCEPGAAALREAEDALCETLCRFQVGSKGNSGASRPFSTLDDASTLPSDTPSDSLTSLQSTQDAMHAPPALRINASEVLSAAMPQVEQKRAHYRGRGGPDGAGVTTVVVDADADAIQVQSQTNAQEVMSQTSLQDHTSKATHDNQDVQHRAIPTRSLGTLQSPDPAKGTMTPVAGDSNAAEPSNAPVSGAASNSPTITPSTLQYRLQSPVNTRFPDVHLEDLQVSTSPIVARSETVYFDAVGFLDCDSSTRTLGRDASDDNGNVCGVFRHSVGDRDASEALGASLPTQGFSVHEQSEKQDTPLQDAPIPTFVNSEKAGNTASSADGFLDRATQPNVTRICIPASLDGPTSPETPASMYSTPTERSSSGSPTFSDATTLLDPLDLAFGIVKDESLDSSVGSDAPSVYCTPASLVLELPLDEVEEQESSDEVPEIVTVQDTIQRDSIADTQEPPPTLGHQVPPELLQRILSYLWDVTYWKRGELPAKEDYRGVGNIALTCRYWAKQSRHLLLKDLYVRSSQDVKRMQAVLNPPPQSTLEHPASLMRWLRLVCSDSNPSWIHQVSGMIAKTPDLARNVLVTLCLQDYPHTTKPPSYCPRSVFHYLPRTWPSLFRHFFELKLTNVHFREAADLFHLLSETHNLRRLSLDNVSWNPTSPLLFVDHLPTYLLKIYVYEADRFGHGGRGILPWILADAIDFSHTPTPQFTDSDKTLASLLTPPDPLPPLCPTHPSQCEAILNMLAVFSHPDVSSILESSQEVVWDLSRLQNGHVKLGAAVLCILARQRFPGEAHNPVVSPRLELTFEPRGSDILGAEHLYVTQIALDVRAFNPTLEELLLYNWREFFISMAQLEHLESVNMCLKTEMQCSRMFDDHKLLITELAQSKRHGIVKACTYRYSIEGVGVRWSITD